MKVAYVIYFRTCKYLVYIYMHRVLVTFSVTLKYKVLVCTKPDTHEYTTKFHESLHSRSINCYRNWTHSSTRYIDTHRSRQKKKSKSNLRLVSYFQSNTKWIIHPLPQNFPNNYSQWITRYLCKRLDIN